MSISDPYPSQVLRRLAGTIFATVLSASLQAQTVPAPVLSLFQQKAQLAFAPSGATFSNLTLTGSVDRTAGATKETGTITLHSSADGSSAESWSGAGADRVSTCTAWNETRSCALSLAGKTQGLGGVANQRTVTWFAPWMALSLLSSLVSDATESKDSKGDEVLTFAPAYGSLASLSATRQKQVQSVGQAAAVQVLYDAGTALPSGMHYTEPLSTETSNAIDISIVYGDYSLEQGFMVPHHIQRYIQRTLESDVHITSVSLN